MAQLNYKHLRYFWAIAHAGSLAAAAERLSVSQSALSTQLRQLEVRLGHALFDRRHRRLELTEAGRIALEFADSIFKAGDELLRTLEGSHLDERQQLRVGAVATLSRNFQIQLLAPVLRDASVDLTLRTGSLRELLASLDSHNLDVVLSNLPVPREAHSLTRSQRIAEQGVSLVSSQPAPDGFRFPDDLDGTRVLLPSWQNNVRAGFDLLLEQAGVHVDVVAEVDDMPMLRLLAREGLGIALVPPVVVFDELAQGVLHELCQVPGLNESFYAITRGRRFPNPLVDQLLTA
ncbi:MAG: LysR family transcriptional regulator [Pseudomonadota bacterium]